MEGQVIKSDNLEIDTEIKNNIREDVQKSTSIGSTIWRCLAIFIFASLLTGLLIIPFSFLGYISLDSVMESDGFEKLSVNEVTLFVVLQALSTLVFVRYFVKKYDQEDLRDLGLVFANHKRDFAKGLGLGAIFILFGFITLFLLGGIIDVKVEFSQMSEVPWLAYLIMFAAVAVYEEVFARGYVINRLVKSTNKYIALFISSLIFMLMHIGNSNVEVLPLINLFLAGIVLGIYYIHKQNLWFSIGLHFTWNFIQGPVLGFEVSGIDIDSWITFERDGASLLTGGDFGFEGSLICSVLSIALIIYLELKYKNKNCS